MASARFTERNWSGGDALMVGMRAGRARGEVVAWL